MLHYVSMYIFTTITWIDACVMDELVKKDMETALKALAAHTSQVPPEAIERVRAWKSENGKKHNMKYAESFRTFTLR